MSKIFKDILSPQVKSMLSAGKIGVLKTDTLYGVVAAADNKTAVERVYATKGRDTSKPCIVLISDIAQLYEMPSRGVMHQLQKVWPGKISVILPAISAPPHLTRSTGSLAYRVPDDMVLRKLLKETGPLIAPSANPEGVEPAKNIEEARIYFQNNVDFYIDSGEVRDNIPSKLIVINDSGERKELR